MARGLRSPLRSLPLSSRRTRAAQRAPAGIAELLAGRVLGATLRAIHHRGERRAAAPTEERAVRILIATCWAAHSLKELTLIGAQRLTLGAACPSAYTSACTTHLADFCFHADGERVDGRRHTLALDDERACAPMLGPRSQSAKSRRDSLPSTQEFGSVAHGLGWPPMGQAHRALLEEIRHRLQTAKDDPKVTNADGSNHWGRTSLEPSTTGRTTDLLSCATSKACSESRVSRRAGARCLRPTVSTSPSRTWF